MFDYPSSSDYVAEYPTTSSLVRLKRTRRSDDIEDDWNNNDNEENDGEPLNFLLEEGERPSRSDERSARLSS